MFQSSSPLADLDFSLDAMELATVDAVDDTAELHAVAEAAELARVGVSYTVALDHARRPGAAPVASIESVGDAFADLEARVVPIVRASRRPSKRYSRQARYAARTAVAR